MQAVIWVCFLYGLPVTGWRKNDPSPVLVSLHLPKKPCLESNPLVTKEEPLREMPRGLPTTPSPHFVFRVQMVQLTTARPEKQDGYFVPVPSSESTLGAVDNNERMI